ncbi:sulfurtransferase [Caldimonas sp.]|uniref:sulfurtransferase n=1 Tax=Caldimonas sp. TaxID=2838790 RepID=UPI00391CF575
MNLPTPLISPEALRAAMASDPAPVLIDVSFDLADPAAGEAAYLQAHLPGAHYLHLERDLSGAKTGRNGRHPLPTREDFAARIAALGIGPDTPVVVYDRQGAMFAARAWWMLRWLGHQAVAVLDGGLPAWQAIGAALQAGPVAPPAPRAYPLRPAAVAMRDAQAVLQALGTPGQRLIDARAPERYRGDVEPLDPVAGHIPGAINRFFKDNLDADGRFRPAQALQAEFRALLGDTPVQAVVHQCGSGVTACHNLLAMEAAGLHGSALYPGSWSEWCADPTRPVERG